jgi:hypothetical protein
MAQMLPTPAGVDAGPPGDFTWKGLNWHRRRHTEGGGPSFSGRWNPANVVGPDHRGWITLKLTNPSGRAPEAAEFDSTRLGTGYGTYTIVVDADLTELDPNIVFGGVFTYDSTVPKWRSHSEIDVNETSAWGEEDGVHLDNAFFRDNHPGAQIGRSVVAKTLPVPSARLQTHQMVWEPGRITYRSWLGAGGKGRPFRTTIVREHVPVPHNEAIVFNIWDFAAASRTARPASVTIRDFSYVPRVSAASPSS